MSNYFSYIDREIIQTFRPVFFKKKCWDLCLAKDIIITIPLGFWLSLKNEFFSVETPPEILGPRMLSDTGDINWMRYSISELFRIGIYKSKYSRTNIVFFPLNKELNALDKEVIPDKYDFKSDQKANACREFLHQLYGTLVYEDGFDK
ncbi:MAG: hypothetical protein JW882_13070 [Deltaproteobacteria bacterium]|nr:hypothetical protein [Deltaproteobacteria bacterium]